MAKNKILFGSDVLIDLTEDTIVPERLCHGFTAHDRSGEQIEGTSWSFPLDPLFYDYNIGYVNNGTWMYENPTNTYTDIYVVQAGHSYFITLGGNVGSRFRAMFTTTDVTQSTSNVTGTMIVNKNNPANYANASFLNAPSDGYIIVAKDNVGKSGLYSYCYDAMMAWA